MSTRGILVFCKKKEKNSTPEEREETGDQWGHVAIDPVTKMIPSWVLGKRTAENTGKLLKDVKQRVIGVPFFTSDEYKPYKQAILEQYGERQDRKRKGNRGRFPKPKLVPFPELIYATVHKTRKKGRVVKIEYKLIFGTEERLEQVLKDSPVSTHINTAFIERSNRTERMENARLTRKTENFSKEVEPHKNQMEMWRTYYHFVRPHMGLDRKKTLTPSMAADLTDHIWTIQELGELQRHNRSTNRGN